MIKVDRIPSIVEEINKDYWFDIKNYVVNPGWVMPPHCAFIVSNGDKQWIFKYFTGEWDETKDAELNRSPDKIRNMFDKLNNKTPCN